MGEIDDENRLLGNYASRLKTPTFAYLRSDGFKGEFQKNGLINEQMYETLSKCIYVGRKGITEELNIGFICQVNICPCRQTMRYSRGSKIAAETEHWESQRVALNINLAALQRDVLKEDEIVLSRNPHW